MVTESRVVRRGWWSIAVELGALITGFGCANGRLFTHVVVPLDVNLNETPVFTQRAENHGQRFQYYVRIEWGHQGVGEIAREQGLNKVYYADLETWSVLGIWTQRYVHVYGE